MVDVRNVKVITKDKGNHNFLEHRKLNADSMLNDVYTVHRHTIVKNKI